jgi:ABC-2 type transport system ATP-binding protein
VAHVGAPLPEHRFVIRVEHVSKTFAVWRRAGRVRRERVIVDAVDDVSFSVDAGEMVGYVGPNGAGKSTTIKMLTGVLVPTSGHVHVAGLVPSRERVALARRIGVVFGQRSLLWWDLPLADSFDLLRHIYKVDSREHRERLDECIELLQLDEFIATPVRQLSLGQRMRGELTAALLHNPELLFLDEPTVGLDVVSKDRVRTFLADLNARHGTTVLLTTHDLDDIERLCSRLLIIDHGHVIYDGGLDALRDKYGTERTLVIDLAESAAPIEVGAAEVVKIDGPRQWLRFRRDDTTAAELIADIAARYPLRDLTLEEPAIEDIVRRIYVEGL